MDMAAIHAMIGSLKAATDISKALFDLQTTAEVQSKVIAIQSALLDAQSSALVATNAQFSLQEKVRELESQIKNLSDWGDQVKRYTLANPWRGPAQVYALKKDQANGEEPHLLCPNCFHNKKRVILNPMPDKNSFISMVCPACKSTCDTGYRGIGAPKFAEEYNSED